MKSVLLAKTSLSMVHLQPVNVSTHIRTHARTHTHTYTHLVIMRIPNSNDNVLCECEYVHACMSVIMGELAQDESVLTLYYIALDQNQ